MNNAIYVNIDINYEKYAKACFNSLEKNYPNHPIVLVYANELSEEFTRYVQMLNNFKIIKYEQFFDSKSLGPVKNNIVYNKYRLWSNEFAEYDTILHLDADTLILKSLDRYFTNEFLTIEDSTDGFYCSTFLKIDDVLVKNLKEDEINFPTKYLVPMANAGVFSIPKKYRTNEHLNYLIYLTNRYENYLAYADQTVFTLWCYKNQIPMTNKYGLNYIPHFSSSEKTYRSLENIYVIHFANKKPDTINFLLWGLVPPKISKEFSELYFKYYNG